jgi:hypothetical protein
MYINYLWEKIMSSKAEDNPLLKYFRQPAIYIRLPSSGRWWKEGSVDLPVNSELPVYPMTTKDEITLKTPDALMNGSGVADVMKSCVPNIKDPWEMPSIDMDAILIAIRIASYGHNMDFDSKCPHCKHENRHTQDLRDSLAGVQCPDYDTPVELAELTVKLKPTRYIEANRSKQINFEEQKMLQALENATLDPDVKAAQVATSMRKLINIGLEVLTAATESITINHEHTVVNPAHIYEFYENSETSIVKAVQDRLGVLNKESGLAPTRVICEECEKNYQVPIEFDYASFFGNGF